MTESQKWQSMMLSCRKACRILGIEFDEPEYLNWTMGSIYHSDLWKSVYARNRRRSQGGSR